MEDDPLLRAALRRALRSRDVEHVEEAGTVADGTRLLSAGFDLLVLDVRLPDGSGVSLAEAALALEPAPLIIVLSGEASAAEAFRLAQLGVMKFVSKPLSLDELSTVLDLVDNTSERLQAIAKSCVGATDLREAQGAVRRAMVQQALALSKGNREVAAQFLRITRQAVQRFLRTARSP